MSGYLGITKTLDRVVAELFGLERTIQKLGFVRYLFKRVAVDIVGPIEPRSD